MRVGSEQAHRAEAFIWQTLSGREVEEFSRTCDITGSTPVPFLWIEGQGKHSK